MIHICFTVFAMFSSSHKPMKQAAIVTMSRLLSLFVRSFADSDVQLVQNKIVQQGNEMFV